MGNRLTKRTRAAAISALCVLALGLTACSNGDDDTGDATANTIGGAASEIETAVTTAMELSGSSAAIIGVWKGDDAAYVQGFGDGVTANSRIRGAQATQPVLCAALLDLVAEGKLSLDREVVKDFPRQVGIDGITYGQLCTAKSGLGDFKAGLTSIFVNNPTRGWPDRELLAQGFAHSPLSWPGLDVHISDTNAVLLGRALHQVTGEDLPELLDQHVFEKAGMPSSYYPSAPLTDLTVRGGMDGLVYPLAAGEPVCDAPVQVDEVSPSMLAGAGATVTTVTDLKNFYEHYLGGTFGADSQALITDAVSTINPKRDENGEAVEDAEGPTDEQKAAERFWGFGLEKVDSLYGMSGSITGTITASYHDPESGFSVVVSLNNSTAGAGFAKTLALQLAALAGEEMSVSAEDQAAALAASAVCQVDEEAEAEGE